MSPSRLITAAVIVTSVFTAALNGNPALSTGQFPMLREMQYSCEPFHQPYCHCFSPTDRTHARFPNPRGQGAEDAQLEFAHFVRPSRNVIKNGCSDKIGTLLCFFYFPHCNPPTVVSTDSTMVQRVQNDDYSLPCRELCEEVRRDCEGEFSTESQERWPEHLNCSALPSSNCITGSDPAQGYDACVQPPTPNPTEIAQVPTETPTVQPPEMPTIIDLPPEVDRACEPFDQPYCRCFNPDDRTHAVFPNHQNQTVREAEREFNHFIQPSGNVIKSGCSNKIGTLLCFFYFPPCNPPEDGDASTAVAVTDFLPCRELCEEVRRDCKDEFINNWQQPQWQDFYLHLDCSRLPSTTTCINGSDPQQGYDACVEGNSLNIVKPREPEAPVSTVPPCDPGSCPRCSLRRNCVGSTFVNNDYTWAARVRVLIINGSKNGKKIFLVEKKEQYLFYPLQPTLQDVEIIHTTNPECCNNCPGDIVVGGIYLFSGAYNTSTLEWYLDVKNHGGLVSEWSQRYETNLAAWIARGVASRSREK